jgi:hypothetical protein
MAMTKPVMSYLVKPLARAPRLVSGVQTLHVAKPARRPVMGLWLQMQRQMLHSPNAFPLQQRPLAVLPGYLAHYSEMLQIAGKTRRWTTSDQGGR